MKNLTRTIRLAVAAAAILTVTAQAAQARPYTPPKTHSASTNSASHGAITASVRATDLIMRPTVPVTASARATDLIMRPTGTGLVQKPVMPTVVVRAGDQGFDWAAAAIGVGSVLAIMMIATATITARGRRRIAV
jgi:hypothetical protein